MSICPISSDNKKSLVSLLVRKKDGHVFSRLTDVSKGYSVLSAYPLLHFYGGEGLLHDNLPSYFAPYDEKFVWVDEKNRQTHVLNQHGFLNFESISALSINKTVQKHQLKQLIELGWIKKLIWTDSDVNFELSVDKDSQYLWDFLGCFNDAVICREIWSGLRFITPNQPDYKVTLGADIKEKISQVFSLKPASLVFPLEYETNNWQLFNYKENDETDFELYEKLLYGQMNMTSEDVQSWRSYFKRMTKKNLMYYQDPVRVNKTLDSVQDKFDAINSTYELKKMNTELKKVVSVYKNTLL